MIYQLDRPLVTPRPKKEPSRPVESPIERYMRSRGFYPAGQPPVPDNTITNEEYKR